MDEYNVTYSQVCACLPDTNGEQETTDGASFCLDPLRIAYPTLYKGDKNMAPLSPEFLCDVQKRDVSLSDDPTNEDFKLFSQTPQLRLRVKRDAVFEVSKENATRYCAERISETKIGKLCAKVGVNVQALVNICSVDIQVNIQVTLFKNQPPFPTHTHIHPQTHKPHTAPDLLSSFSKSQYWTAGQVISKMKVKMYIAALLRKVSTKQLFSSLLLNLTTQKLCRPILVDCLVYLDDVQSSIS